MSDRESMAYDVVVVGAGPAGLATAIRLKQLAAAASKEVSVCVVEKGSEVGAHILSGAVIDPGALAELFPDWKAQGAPLNQPVTEDRFLFLTRGGSWKVPGFMLPECFRNHGNYIASLGSLCRWMGQQAEALGVEIYPGFAAASVLFTDDNRVRGVATGDMGIGKTGEKTARYQPGIELEAKYTIFAEGARGHLGKRLQAHFALREACAPQVYGIGLKELWEVAPERHVPGLVVHTAGWPLDAATYGGSFMYHMENRQVAVGFVVGLGYSNPYLSPFEEFQRYKTHPAIRGFLEGGRRISYGARAIAAGGLQSLPKLVFPGGALVGDDAGFLNASRIKGTHAAIKSGMLAAQAAFEALGAGRSHDELAAFPSAFGIELAAGGAAPRAQLQAVDVEGALHRHAHGRHRPGALSRQGAVDPHPCPCGPRNFEAEGKRPPDRVSAARRRAHLRPALLGVRVEHQPRGGPARPPAPEGPRHSRPRSTCRFTPGPESRYCPAGVYEFVTEGGATRLQINAPNCVHCKTCDIKDPAQNIEWVVPEGGGGPNYPNM